VAPVASSAHTSPGEAFAPAPAAAPPAGPYYAAQPYGGYAQPGAPAGPPRRQKPLTAIALIIGALLLAGGGTAAALIIAGQKKDKAVAAAPAAQPIRTVVKTTPAPRPKKQPKPVVHTPQAPLTPTHTPTPTPTPSSSTSDAAAAQQAVIQHFRAIEANDFSRAYTYIDPVQFPDRTGWITSHEKAQIQQVILSTARGTASGSTATVPVTSLITIEGCGRKDWGSTTYDMVKRGGRWLIHASNYAHSPACT
jgi:hypothetical protein